MHFNEWKILYFDWNFTEVCLLWSNWQQHSSPLNNGLVPNRRQAIIWNNADPIHWRKYTALRGDESTYGKQFYHDIARSFEVVGFVFRGSIHQADGRLIAWSRKVSEQRDSGFGFFNRSEFDRHLGSSAAEMPFKFQSNHYNIQYRDVETSRDLVVRRLTV